MFAPGRGGGGGSVSNDFPGTGFSNNTHATRRLSDVIHVPNRLSGDVAAWTGRF
jgi:hypothetical protein